jgi:hypothetical protein
VAGAAGDTLAEGVVLPSFSELDRRALLTVPSLLDITTHVLGLSAGVKLPKRSSRQVAWPTAAFQEPALTLDVSDRSFAH